jgi:hypothetical protein
MNTNRNCRDCGWFETFKPRADEPSNMGCTQPDWAGYIINPEKPDCGGYHYFKKTTIAAVKGDNESIQNI